MEVLAEKGILDKVERIGCKSAGAINAILAGLNYSVHDMGEILWKLNFNNFMDDSWGIIRDTDRWINECG